MKKINSNGYGHKIIGAAAVFIAAVPSCLYLIELLSAKSLTVLKYISLAIGLTILLVFIELLSIEFYQDRKINREYANMRKTKLPLGNGEYECQSCGSKLVKCSDKSCGVCGIKFETALNPQQKPNPAYKA